MLSLGFVQSQADKCLFTLREEGKVILLAVWVDDFVVACSDPKCWEILLIKLKAHFTITGGELQQFLGLVIVRNRKLKMPQSTMTVALVQKAQMQDCNPVPVPCAAGMTFTRQDCPIGEEKEKMERLGKGPTQFRQKAPRSTTSLVGLALMWCSWLTNSPSSCPIQVLCTGAVWSIC
jgi:hypothetical protein